ncbi:hypothetical protein FQN60_014096 [Etheostoma spectabile]|uniref:Uncharacterized protein n=1 Tax=Etheostoma spectabile TaxID=54343 RepID=A0A5J5D611_9PERO|nr:hypothetical protein FQN60_014096 [Etheostoma spectabile]
MREEETEMEKKEDSHTCAWADLVLTGSLSLGALHFLSTTRGLVHSYISLKLLPLDTSKGSIKDND